MGVKVKVIGVKKAIQSFDDYFKRKKQGLLGVVAGTSASIQKTAQQLAPIDLGELKSEIISTVIERNNLISGDVLSGSPYSAFVEFGTRPHRAPISALEGWAKRHGIPVGAVWNSIAKKGTKAQPFMTPAAMKGKNIFIKGVTTVMSSP